MIYLILDTNIWLYLCNGFDPVKNNLYKNIYTEGHFELLKSLIRKTNDKEITILINDVIIDEFERNKQTAYSLIYEAKKQEEEIFQKIKSLKKVLSKETLASLIDEVENGRVSVIRNKIQSNDKHINDVQQFFKSDCVNIPISNETYIRAAKLAINKSAPFHHSKNNMADAVILLSSIEYLQNIELDELNYAIFVSNNTKEYANNPKVEDVEFHADILTLLGHKELIYKRFLWEAVDLSDSLQEDIQYWLEYRNFLRAEKKFWCRMPDCNNEAESFGSFGYFDSLIKVFNYDKINNNFNTSQLSLFAFTEEDRKNLNHIRQTEKGACGTCHTVHIACPSCGKLICDPEDWGEFYCFDCDLHFDIVDHPILNEKVLSQNKSVLLSPD